ncbi:MAG: arginase [Candidatus Saccharibacteria bacterium]
MIKIVQAATSLGSFNKGSEKAPATILDTTLRSGLKKNMFEFSELEPVTAIEETNNSNKKLRNLDSLISFNKTLFEQITSSADNKDIVLTLGGDHSISIGTLFASKARNPQTCIVYIDAHPDCSNPIDSPTGNIHGMPLSTVLGDALWVDFELPKYQYNEVFIIGAKDIDEAEYRYMQAHNITCYTIDDIIRHGIAKIVDEIRQKVASRPLHISLDIDSIDSSEAPGTGIVNRGGLSYREVSYLCRELSKEDIIALDCVEVNPERDINNKTVLLSGDLCVSLLGGDWSPYTQYLEKDTN